MINQTVLLKASLIIGLFLFILFGFQVYQFKKSHESLLQELYRLQVNFGKSVDGNDPYVKNEVKNTILKNAGKIQACYNEYLGTKPKTTTGITQIDWRIDIYGNVLIPEIVRSNFTEEKFRRCLTDKISLWTFPPPPIEKYVSHKFSFAKR
ncbi:hypothetical protein LEP1GSC047_1788 [Leptospira inadai serovar Lyme str. 10]|uniref:Uncharacterized protein n=2 Tax=Leptospira inadai serovar Lyme TaxID=293084 RepID=V6HSC8_9LEPT|nr:AgmX/PglI C-terminal domain-containing protein [Leptospira inadai]EQA35499.1 hypothetical protein LEP1GSC047_1788 [Leptospira inadai serovar Lyme str. 10]PNV73985.1 hypothetical protein BES34_016340 [Leptospira inadai serovar Lyme]